MNKQPTKQELEAAINKHVQRSAEIVARIPWEKRTIVSRIEIEERRKHAHPPCER